MEILYSRILMMELESSRKMEFRLSLKVSGYGSGGYCDFFMFDSVESLDANPSFNVTAKVFFTSVCLLKYGLIFLTTMEGVHQCNFKHHEKRKMRFISFLYDATRIEITNVSENLS